MSEESADYSGSVQFVHDPRHLLPPYHRLCPEQVRSKYRSILRCTSCTLVKSSIAKDIFEAISLCMFVLYNDCACR